MLLMTNGCSRHQTGIIASSDEFSCACGHNWATFHRTNGVSFQICNGSHSVPPTRGFFKVVDNKALPLSAQERAEVATWINGQLQREFSPSDFDHLMATFITPIEVWEVDSDLYRKVRSEISEEASNKADSSKIRTYFYLLIRLQDFINFPSVEFN